MVIHLADQDLQKNKNLADRDLPKNTNCCTTCGVRKKKKDLVVSKSSIDEFGGDGKVYLFEYGVNPVLFLAKLKEGLPVPLLSIHLNV